MNAPVPSRSFRPRSCQKCGGDAFFDASDAAEWRCLQCGRSLPNYAAQAPEEDSAPISARRAGWDGPGADVAHELPTRRSSVRRRFMRPAA